MWSLLSLLKLFSTKFTNLSVFLTWSRTPSNVCSAVRGWCFVVESICQLGSKKAKNKRRKKKHTTRHLVLMAFVVSSVYGQFLRSWTHEEINNSTRENKLLCSSRQSLFLNIWLLTPHPQKIYIYIYIYINFTGLPTRIRDTFQLSSQLCDLARPFMKYFMKRNGRDIELCGRVTQLSLTYRATVLYLPNLIVSLALLNRF